MVWSIDLPLYSTEQSLSWKPNRFSASQKKKILAFYWTRRLITAYTSVTCPSTDLNPVHAPHPFSWRSILILSSHLCLGLPSGLFPSGFPTKILYTPLLSPHTCYIPHPRHFSRFDHPNKIGWGVHIIKFLILCVSLFPCYLDPP